MCHEVDHLFFVSEDLWHLDLKSVPIAVSVAANSFGSAATKVDYLTTNRHLYAEDGIQATDSGKLGLIKENAYT